MSLHWAIPASPALTKTFALGRALPAALFALAIVLPSAAHSQSGNTVAAQNAEAPGSYTYSDGEYAEAACNRTRQRLSEVQNALPPTCRAEYNRDQMAAISERRRRISGEMEVINFGRRELKCIEPDRLDAEAFARCRRLDRDYLSLSSTQSDLDRAWMQLLTGDGQCGSLSADIRQMQNTLAHCDAAAAQRRQALNNVINSLRGAAGALISGAPRSGATPRGSGR